MNLIASAMEKHTIQENGLADELTAGLDSMFADVFSHGKAKPGRILVATLEIYEKENQE